MDEDFYDVDVFEEDQIVKVKRLSRPYDTLDDVRASFDILLEQLKEFDRGEYGVLVDLRNSPPPRNDDAFEQVLAPYRYRLFEGFIAGAIVVKTLPGMIQLSTQAKSTNNAFCPFNQMEEAIAFLQEKIERR